MLATSNVWGVNAAVCRVIWCYHHHNNYYHFWRRVIHGGRAFAVTSLSTWNLLPKRLTLKLLFLAVFLKHFSSQGRIFHSKLGRKLADQSGDEREIRFLFQWLSLFWFWCHLTAWLFCEGGGGVRFIPAWFLYLSVLHSVIFFHSWELSTGVKKNNNKQICIAP